MVASAAYYVILVILQQLLFSLSLVFFIIMRVPCFFLLLSLVFSAGHHIGQILVSGTWVYTWSNSTDPLLIARYANINSRCIVINSPTVKKANNYGNAEFYGE